MHICIIGDGVAGLMAANFFASKNYVDKITSIGSSKIPTIGVGESTTLGFEMVHQQFDSDFDSFIRESDACVKLGVLYSGWSKKEFLHYFKTEFIFERNNTTWFEYSNFLANKDLNVYIHDLMGNKLISDAKKNLIPKKQLNALYGQSWHFDAGKYILYLKKLLNNNKKVIRIDDIVVNCKFKSNDMIESITLESNLQVIADYFIISTGKNYDSSKIFNIKYKDLGDVLLTDKALFFPKKYQNKTKEIHPYTVAKTMKYGWRWITPTWSRIGTGYVFSSRHTSVENAIKEFQKDIGDTKIVPNIIDFSPRYTEKTFSSNYMTLGMCNGFLEPLDAPGLSISSFLIMAIDIIFNANIDCISNYSKYLHKLNNLANIFYNLWTSFILTQYKTCVRNDTDFWIDHKNIKFEYLDNMLKDLNTIKDSLEPSTLEDLNIITDYFEECPFKSWGITEKDIEYEFKAMIQNTISSKDISWKSVYDTIPFKLDDSDYESECHYSFLKKIHSKFNNN